MEHGASEVGLKMGGDLERFPGEELDQAMREFSPANVDMNGKSMLAAYPPMLD